MKVYISGKITGLQPEEYMPLFDQAEILLKENGFTDLVNPTKLGINVTEDWSRAMAVCMPALEKCQAIYMIDNWKESFGARRELTRAMEKRMITMFGPEDVSKIKIAYPSRKVV
jgi:hypothetical protein